MFVRLSYTHFNPSTGEHTLVCTAPSQLEHELFPCLSTRTECLLSVAPSSSPDLERAAALLRTWRAAPPEYALLDALSLLADLTGYPCELPICSECGELSPFGDDLCEACGLLSVRETAPFQPTPGPLLPEPAPSPSDMGLQRSLQAFL